MIRLMCSDFQELTGAVQEKAAEMLEEGKVERVIGYGRDKYSGEVTPLFITESQQARELIFNENCGMMLAKYLLKHPEKKTGIIAKPCDTRAIAVYLSEGLLERKNLKIIGINNCPGIAGNSACLDCRIKDPVIADTAVGGAAADGKRSGKLEAGADGESGGDAEGVRGTGSGVYRELEEMSPEERLAYFQEEFSRCTRCYACRQACYACYCEECFVDSNQPLWLGGSINLKDNFTYHLMRAMHLAGRCIDCGACETACPEGVDVRALPARLSRFAGEIYQYQAGMDPEEKVLLNQYRFDDPEPGFLELGCDEDD